MDIAKRLILAFGLIVLATGCSTTGRFIVPENTQLYINDRPEAVTIEENGQVTTKPYFWTAVGGVPYRLEKQGDTVKRGKLKTKFRVISIFWPPYTLIYWPIGLRPDITYDLTNDTQE